jgi:dephospho-CoA kinase
MLPPVVDPGVGRRADQPRRPENVEVGSTTPESPRPRVYREPVRRILITGMSGTGKSTALARLRERGFETVDTDEPGWTRWSDDDGGYVWCEDRIADLLARERAVTLYVSGTVSNQGRFYRDFDAVVLMSAPVAVLLQRLESRTTNDYGKSREERELIVRQVAEIEPLLRATCSHEIDATRAVEDVVAELVAIGASRRPT